MPAAPDRFNRAYEGLLDLISRVNAGSVADDHLDDKVSAWLQDYCDGIAVRGEAAILAYRAELGEVGLEVQYEGPRESLLALQRVEASLTGKGQDPQTSDIREVATPSQLSARSLTMRSFVMGECEILMSNEAGQGLVISIKHPSRPLTWIELLRARTVAPDPVPNLFAYVPAPGETFGVSGYSVLLAADPRRTGLL